MLSQEEENALVDSLRTKGANTNAEWLQILRQVLDEGDAPPGTLLGGQVMDATYDWRVGWVQVTLAALEASLGKLALEESNVDVGGLRPPPLEHSYVPRCTEQMASPSAMNATRYSVLVVDRPERNAFSFGFAPQTGDEAKTSPGVIVVCASHTRLSILARSLRLGVS
jgi:hypothetical protein